jgi:XTP/dITP diphosphohydrolase
MSRRLLSEDKLVLASHNTGKLREIRALLEPYGKEVLSAGELKLPEPEETGQSFAENAELKARAAAEASGLPALADDSGLAVASLGGAPGIYSARWAGPEKDFQAAMRRVHEALADDLDRGAEFVCALALAWPDGDVVQVVGRVRGAIVWPPQGEGGFGYDPVFLPEGHTRTFGEMSAQEKQAISHRARAFQALIDAVLPDDTT